MFSPPKIEQSLVRFLPSSTPSPAPAVGQRCLPPCMEPVSPEATPFTPLGALYPQGHPPPQSAFRSLYNPIVKWWVGEGPPPGTRP